MNKSIQIENMSFYPMVSIVIPTFNSAYTLERCLSSIKAQTYENIEVIVIDRYSKDNTEVITRKYRVRFFPAEGNMSIARNYGAQKAKGDYLFFMDSDQLLEPDVVKECVYKSLEERADAIAIPEKSITNNFWSECVASLRDIYSDKIALPRFFNKELFLKFKFNNNLFWGEDVLLAKNIQEHNLKIALITSHLWHYEPDTLISLLGKYYYIYGRGARLMLREGEGRILKFIIIQNIKSAWKKWVYSGKFIKDPIHFLGIIILKTSAYILSFFSFIVSCLREKN